MPTVHDFRGVHTPVFSLHTYSESVAKFRLSSIIEVQGHTATAKFFKILTLLMGKSFHK